MKKILSLVLVLSMVLGSFGFAFAAEEVVPDSVKRVHAAGLFGVGGLELDRIATRAELATLVLRLHGYEDAEIEALKTASNFSDVAATSWYAPYVGLAVQEGLFTGDTGANTFRPLENAKYAELLVVILRALGYGEDLAGLAWPNGYVLKAAEVGIDVDLTKDANSTVSRLVVGATIDKALDLEVKGGEETLGQKLGLEGFEPVEPEPEELEIVGVSADNLKQVVVEFNQDVTDNEEVENVDNYVLENKDGKKMSEIEDVEIDGEFATLTLKTASANQVNRVLVIKKGVTGTELEEEVRFDDFTVPVAEDAEVIGESMIHVVFNEPIKDLKDSTKGFEVESADGKTTYRVRSVKPAKNGKEALVELRSKLKDGDQIVLTVKNDLKDYAGFRLATTEFDLEVIEDDSEIEVIGFRKATEEGITLIFNKNIKVVDADEDNFYHTSSKNTVKEGSINKDSADGNELALDFSDNLLPTGTAYIFVNGGSLEDYWGNDNASTIRFAAEISADTAEPSIDGSIKVSNNGRTLTVNFDKRLDEKSAEDKDNYFVATENSGNEAVKISNVKLSKNEKTVTINLREQLDPGKYVLEVEDVKDALGNAEVNTEKSFTVEGEPLQAEEVSIAVYENKNGSTMEYTILVDYGRSMDTEDERYSVLDLENYSVKFGRDEHFTLAELDDEDDYYVDIDIADDDDEIVEIVIEDSSNTKDLKLIEGTAPNRKLNFHISRVKDANGLLSAALSFAGQNPDLAPEKTFGIDKFEAIDTETLKITFDKTVDKLDLDDLKFNYDVEIDDYDLDGKVLTITLGKELSTDAVATVSEKVYGVLALVYNDETSTVTAYGDKLIVEDREVTDKIAPEIAVDKNDDYIVSAKLDDTNKTVEVTVTFTEAMRQGTFSISSFTLDEEYAKETPVVDGNKVKFVFDNSKKDFKKDNYYEFTYEGRVTDSVGNALDFEDGVVTVQVK